MENVIKNTEFNVNATTGEVLSFDRKETVLVEKEPQYYKVYTKDISNILGLNNAQKAVFQCLASSMGFDNLVVLIKPIKRRLAEITGYSENTITKVIDQLYKLKVLIRLEKSVYRVNPNLVAKGSWEKIKALRLVLEYSENGRTIELEEVTSKKITFKEKEEFHQYTLDEAIQQEKSSQPSSGIEQSTDFDS
jgi:hypothetical protein